MLRPILIVAFAAKALAIGLWCFTTERIPAAIVFIAPDPFLLYAVFAPSAQGICRVFTRFVTDRPAVWLTIDDGPDEQDTPQLLDLLDRHRARATFFVVGEKAQRLPHLVREIVRRGHSIGHHTHTHPTRTFWCATPRRLAAELDRTLAVLERAGVRPAAFRPPVGIKPLFLANALAARGLHCVGWTLRSGDCHIDSPERLVAAMKPRLRPGAILLVHEGPNVARGVRVKGIALLLEALAARNLVCEVPALSRLRCESGTARCL